MNEEIARYSIDDCKEGQSFSFQETISRENVDEFAVLTGDTSTIHIDGKFARERGFKDRVVHGVFLSTYFSRLIGVYYPGENSLLQMLNVKFLAPAYINDRINISAVVDQVSNGTRSLLLKLYIENVDTKKILVKGKAMLGFTG